MSPQVAETAYEGKCPWCDKKVTFIPKRSVWFFLCEWCGTRAYVPLESKKKVKVE